MAKKKSSILNVQKTFEAPKYIEKDDNETLKNPAGEKETASNTNAAAPVEENAANKKTTEGEKSGGQSEGLKEAVTGEGTEPKEGPKADNQGMDLLVDGLDLNVIARHQYSKGYEKLFDVVPAEHKGERMTVKTLNRQHEKLKSVADRRKIPIQTLIDNILEEFLRKYDKDIKKDDLQSLLKSLGK